MSVGKDDDRLSREEIHRRAIGRWENEGGSVRAWHREIPAEENPATVAGEIGDAEAASDVVEAPQRQDAEGGVRVPDERRGHPRHGSIATADDDVGAGVRALAGNLAGILALPELVQLDLETSLPEPGRQRVRAKPVGV